MRVWNLKVFGCGNCRENRICFIAVKTLFAQGNPDNARRKLHVPMTRASPAGLDMITNP